MYVVIGINGIFTYKTNNIRSVINILTKFLNISKPTYLKKSWMISIHEKFYLYTYRKHSNNRTVFIIYFRYDQEKFNYPLL